MEKLNKTKENLKPNIHFSPGKGWLNDPNGCVYNNGIYQSVIKSKEMRNRKRTISLFLEKTLKDLYYYTGWGLAPMTKQLTFVKTFIMT